jgi:hypothetical protein
MRSEQRTNARLLLEIEALEAALTRQADVISLLADRVAERSPSPTLPPPRRDGTT